MASPGNLLAFDILTKLLPVILLIGWWLWDRPWLFVSMSAFFVGISFRIYLVPRARRQVLIVYQDVDEILKAMTYLGWLNEFSRYLILVAFVIFELSRTSQSQCLPVVLGVGPRTLRSGQLRSTVRTGYVDHPRVKSTHTETEWVVQIKGPITIRISKEDSEFADLVMVILYQAAGPDGRRYLDQATIGQIFRLSRQMTNVRISLYKRRERIEDVLIRERLNHTLKTPTVEAIHRILHEDPFCGATEVRRRLVQQGHLPREKDISLPSITRAMRTVDYIAIQRRLKVLLGNGDVVPNFEKLCQILLQEMSVLAEAAGKKIGQKIITVAALLDPTKRLTKSPSHLTVAPTCEALKDPANVVDAADNRLLSGWAGIFLMYFTYGASYREIALYLGVHASTVYRRLRQIHRRLPPLQPLLGCVRYSGVVGIDEKYILAPKPHREGKMARWVYLYVAVDPLTYDLLHVEVYPKRNTECAKAFLLGLKAKGVLAPKVIVTDLWEPYEKAVPEVFPNALHHQCVFHAEQAASTLMREKLGSDFANIPEARELRSAIIALFRSGSRRTLRRRYAGLLKRRETLETKCPELAPVFESLARHFEKVANAYSDRRVPIPHTNNAVETVIRCFTRRYKTMGGFETLESARAYAYLWGYYYRFRPFSPDANPRIRNKSPIQLAGYELEAATCLDLVMGPAPPE